MRILILIFSSLICLAGAGLIISPESSINIVESNLNQNWLYILAIVTRIAFGSLLIIMASSSKYPKTIKTMGVIAVLAGLALVFLGQGKFQDLTSSAIFNLKPFIFIAGSTAILLGGFLIITFIGRNNYKSY